MTTRLCRAIIPPEPVFPGNQRLGSWLVRASVQTREIANEEPEPEPGPAEPEPGSEAWPAEPEPRSEARPATGRRSEARSAAAGSEPPSGPEPRYGPLVRTQERVRKGPCRKAGPSFCAFSSASRQAALGRLR